MIIRSLLFVFMVSAAASAQWIRHTVNTTAGFRGLSVVNEKVIWASGTGGTVIRTPDGGKNWKVMTVPGAEKLDFRDVEAFDANIAYILSIGNGETSRIYKTTDGGTTWSLQFTNKNEKAFFDAIACWDKNNCIAMSDPIDGHYLLISTSDGGANWKHLTGNQMPPARDGEAAFAASGTCLITLGTSTAFLVTGGEYAHVFRSDDHGATWSFAETPIISGTPGSGIFSIAMYDSRYGVIVGGNYEKPAEHENTLAFTTDGGKAWTAAPGLTGYRSAVAFIEKRRIIAVGTNGTDISTDGGENWKKIGGESLNSVAAKGKNAVWAVGPNGTVLKLDSKPHPRAATSEATYPHRIDVNSVHMSHSIIARDCSQTEHSCSHSTTIEVGISGPEMGNAPHEYVYTVSGGKIIGEGLNVRWDLSNVKPGQYMITAGIRIPLLGGSTWGFGGRTRTEAITIR